MINLHSAHKTATLSILSRDVTNNHPVDLQQCLKRIRYSDSRTIVPSHLIVGGRRWLLCMDHDSIHLIATEANPPASMILVTSLCLAPAACQEMYRGRQQACIQTQTMIEAKKPALMFRTDTSTGK